MKAKILAVYVLNLEKLNNYQLASLHWAIEGFRAIQERDLCYEKVMELGLVTADGKPHDEYLVEAIAFEVQKRMEKGTYI